MEALEGEVVEHAVVRDANVVVQHCQALLISGVVPQKLYVVLEEAGRLRVAQHVAR